MSKGFTFKACDDCTRVKAYGKAAGDCAKKGMKMLQPGAQMNAAKMLFAGKYFPARGHTNAYICAGVTTTGSVSSTSEKVSHEQISRAEAGKYVITFGVKDSSGNKQCKLAKRTVVVKDTLPPVITVTLGGKLIHTSAFAKKNPAGNPKVNPFFMEEHSMTVNGWTIGAVASAVAGVALLGLANRRTTVHIDV